jgi:hypothetical protein
VWGNFSEDNRESNAISDTVEQPIDFEAVHLGVNLGPRGFERRCELQAYGVRVAVPRLAIAMTSSRKGKVMRGCGVNHLSSSG